jgi:hypothetical protein
MFPFKLLCHLERKTYVPGQCPVANQNPVSLTAVETPQKYATDPCRYPRKIRTKRASQKVISPVLIEIPFILLHTRPVAVNRVQVRCTTNMLLQFWKLLHHTFHGCDVIVLQLSTVKGAVTRYLLGSYRYLNGITVAEREDSNLPLLVTT